MIISFRTAWWFFLCLVNAGTMYMSVHGEEVDLVLFAIGSFLAGVTAVLTLFSLERDNT